MDKNVNSIEFSVLTSVYCNDDPEKFFASITSILENTILPKKIMLIVDGFLPARLQNEVSKFESNDLFEIIYSSKNIGLANALNLCLDKINTDWIFRSDADDFNLKNRFEEYVRFIISNPNIDIFGSQILEFDEFGRQTKKRLVPIKNIDILRSLKYKNPFNHMTVAFRTSLFQRVGGYPNLYLREDYGLWIKFATVGAVFSNLDNVFVHVSAGSKMIERRGGIKYALAEIELQKMLIANNQNNYIFGIIIGGVRFIIFVMPYKFRKFIYENFLRK